MIKQKSQPISKHQVWKAFKKVKANKGSAGVDHESLKEYERNLEDNLYKLWNRLASGSYFPPPVLEVEIRKKDGGVRKLGIPTVGDRIAQMVIRDVLEPQVESKLHRDSYGYRQGKSAHDAIDKARKLCWRCDWVIDLDIKGFFDNLDHQLLMRAVRYHTQEKWVLMYIERWLKAPIRIREGREVERHKGTPQGGVVSPLLANIFLHHAFDRWMEEEFPTIEFERYADDVIVHCMTYKQADYLLKRIRGRLLKCKLELHPEKTRIVYCKDETRAEKHKHTKFTFLGYTFQCRKTKTANGKTFVSFTPAISKEALSKMYRKIRQLKIHCRTGQTIEDIAELLNPIIRGWINYYGRFRKSALNFFFHRLNLRLLKWVSWKYKRCRNKNRRSVGWLANVYKSTPNLFAHWNFGVKPRG